MGLLIVLAIYTVLILVFVPLDKIGRAQVAIKKQIKRVLDKVGD